MHGTSNSLAVLAARIREEHDAAEAAKGAAVVAARKGIEHALAAGELLLEAKAQVPHGQWLPWLGENCPTISERMARYYMRLARNRLELEAQIGNVSDLSLREAVRLLEGDNGEGEDEIDDDDTSRDEVGDGDYYTHRDLTAAAREVMGAIDLDPSSCRLANEGVQAARFYGVHEDGLKQQWEGRVWLNPPFGDWGSWAPKALDEIRAGRVTEMCVFITANATTGKALKDLKDQADAVMISNGRMNCWGPKATTPPEGNYIFYFGPNVAKFQEVFSRHGTVFLGRGPGSLTLDGDSPKDEGDKGPDPEPNRPHLSSVCVSDDEALANIMTLHNAGQAFDLDPCYSLGMFYRGDIPKPKYRFDISPPVETRADGVIKADSTRLPLPSNSLKSIVCDLPFMFGTHGQTANNLMTKRFTMFDSYDDLKKVYRGSLQEFHRVLDRGGLLAFKCQDYTDGKTTMTHCLVYQWALEQGFYAKVSNSKLQQRHARKFHSYWWVFTKRPLRREKLIFFKSSLPPEILKLIGWDGTMVADAGWAKASSFVVENDRLRHVETEQF